MGWPQMEQRPSQQDGTLPAFISGQIDKKLFKKTQPRRAENMWKI